MGRRSSSDQRKRKLAVREGRDGATASRRLEGKGRKMKDPQSRWGDLCSHGLICPLIPDCVDRWVQSTLQCGFCQALGPRRTSHGRLPPRAQEGQKVSPVHHFTEREQCLPVMAPCKMLLFGHDSQALWDFQSLPNRRRVKWQHVRMGAHASQQIEVLLSWNPGCHLKPGESPDLRFPKALVQNQDLLAGMIIRFSANERELPPGMQVCCARALAHFFN